MPEQAGHAPTKAEFSEQVNGSFKASAPSVNDFDLELIKFTDIADNETVETFSLMFRAPVGVAPSQATYTLSSERTGSMDIFLVPISQDDQGVYFEAIFNRLKPKKATV